MTTTDTHSDDPVRLPRGVLPRRYDVALVIDPDESSFSGHVSIDVEIVDPSDRIVLNSLDLVLSEVSVTDATGVTQRPVVSLEPQLQRATFRVDEMLTAGPARVDISFTGPFCEDLVGLYRSTFTTDGVERHLAVTQFESTDARRAFPCFDEPDMKAVFAVSLVVPDGMVAVSNAAEATRDVLDDGMVLVRFADTMVMSTYLVAFVVGPLEVSGPRMVAGVNGDIPLRIIHPPCAPSLTSFAFEVADAGLRFLESYYDVPYPGGKVDLVAVPDFASGAMENLGCITFREVELLIDQDRSTQTELQRVAAVINHELAHMWFGDLVTMGWWNGIWLNEAFATFMEVAASDSFRPEWDVWTAFGLARSAAFATDSLCATRPIEFDVHSPSDAAAMFDVLTYEKGASVLRMLEQYLGADRFRDGIRHYLQVHAFGNTDTADLWAALEEVTGEPVGEIMDGWIFRGGHPVVSAESTDTGVVLSQRPVSPPSGSSMLGESWLVPLVVSATVDGAELCERVLLGAEPQTLELGGRPSTLQVNTGGDGFFRSELPERLRVAAALDPASPLERVVLVDDAWAALLRGDMSVVEVTDLVRLVAWREMDPSVWRRVAALVDELAHLVGGWPTDAVSSLAVDVARPAFTNVSRLLDAELVAVEDRDRFRDLRGILVSLLGVTGQDRAVLSAATDVVMSGVPADGSLFAASVDVVAASATPAEHAMFEGWWRDAATPQDTIRFLYAMVDSPHEVCFDRALGLVLSEIRSQNCSAVLRRALAHPRFGERAWNFMVANWDAVTAKLPASALLRTLSALRWVNDPDWARRVEEFLADRAVAEGELALAQHLERMWVSVRAAERVRSELL